MKNGTSGSSESIKRKKAKIRNAIPKKVSTQSFEYVMVFIPIITRIIPPIQKAKKSI
ncbi:MAG: hypothetical protein HFJ42_07725 [Clostridia bacterium]|nr:hypothetical protein [Clostridia bacterium]